MNKSQKIIKWIARIFSGLIVFTILFFFIGEFNLEDISLLHFRDVVALFFIPLAYGASSAVAWKKELIGGALMLMSVILFNVSSWVFDGFTGLYFDFGLALIPAVLFIISHFLKKRS